MYVFPLIGLKLIDEIKPRDLSIVLEHIEEKGFIEVLDKVKRRLAAIFAHAVSKGYIEQSPAIHLKGALTQKSEEKHHPKLPLDRLCELFQRLKMIQVDRSQSYIQNLHYTRLLVPAK